MKTLATIALLYGVGSTSVAHAQANQLTGSVRACEADDAAACDRLKRRLETLFAGGHNAADRALGHKLASAAAKLLRDSAAPHVVVEPIARCASNDADACNRIANVLTGIFTGSDAQLDASRDRALARAFASQLVSQVHP
jgi:hypothetical protein